MFEIALLRPEIPPNTGNIIRLCANMGSKLHIIGPIGFSLDDKQMRRAGLDYHDQAVIHLYDSFEAFHATLNAENRKPKRLLMFSSQGKTTYTNMAYTDNDILMFGPETLKFPAEVLQKAPVDDQCRIPMQDQSRCLNLSNAVAIVAYEAWRQNGFIGGQ